MAAVEASVDLPNDSAVNRRLSSDSEDDVVVRRKSKHNAVLSDDEEDEVHVAHMKIGNDNIKVTDLKNYGDKNTVNRDDVKSESINSNSNECVPDEPVEGKEDSQRNPRNEEEPCQKTKGFRNILDSDSEDENMFDSLLNNNKISPSNKQPRDSRSISTNSERLIQMDGDEKIRFVSKLEQVLSHESEDEEDIADPQQGSSTDNLNPSKISSLIDSDSEEDLSTRKFGGSSDEDEPITKPNAIKKKGQREKKKPTGSLRAAKEEAMREIHSETQRMLRESQVRLPYHRPRQRTLQEFLNRRKNLPALPTTLTTAAKVKMSGKIVRKVLEEKEKEAELFYKSSTDSEHEEGTKAELLIANIRPNPTLVENNVENVAVIEENHKITRKDLQNSHGVKDVIKQGDESLGVPQKLFIISKNEADVTEGPLSAVEENSETTAMLSQGFNQRRKNYKQGLKDVAIPRNLFGSECDEPMDISHEQSEANADQGDHRIDKNQEECEVNNRLQGPSKKLDQFVEDEMINELPINLIAQRNESVEGEAEDFELKMSEDLNEMTNDETPLYDIPVKKTNAIEFEAITVTPFINNREALKLNGNKEVESGIITINQNLAVDSEPRSKDICLNSVENEQSSINVKVPYDNEDSEDNNEPIGHVYGLPLPEFQEDKSKRTKTRILPDIMSITPKLQGSPDTVIELSPPKVGVNLLMKRFLNHCVTKKTPEFTPEVTAICTEQTSSGLRVIKEVLPYKISVNEKNDDPELSKPGAKLTRLKEELQQQMAIQRTKEWKEKDLEMKTLEADVYCDELSDCGKEDDDNVEDEEDDDNVEDEEDEEEEKEEGEGEEVSSNSEGSDFDEDDLPIKENRKKYKSPFLDAEAEVSGDESDEREGGNISDEDDREDVDIINSSNKDSKAEQHKESETEASQRNKTSKSKRIIKAFADSDSDDSEVEGMHTNQSDASKDRRFRKTKTEVDMFAMDDNSDDDSLSGTEGDLPVYQQRIDERSQSCATPSVANNSLSIVSPITQLTALNTGSESLNIDTRTSQNPLQLMAPRSLETTPIEAKCYRECNSEKREKLQKKLFDDNKQTPSDVELIGLCSGQFFENPSDNGELDRLMHTTRKTNVSDAELLNLCSGTFATQPLDIEKLEAGGEEVQDLLVPSNTSSFPSPNKSSKEQVQKHDTVLKTCKIVSSSDDEDNTHNLQVKKSLGKNLRKKVKKLQLSEDENESVNESLSDLDERENNEEKFIDYDSEENEVVVTKKHAQKAAAGFVDAEAELSESEWGSADEDERDLDELDYEEGDLEDIDQDQVKKQLEKIHMRQVLDADQREVRLFQEIFLEDGELHSDSASRQRKFKWKNIDELEEDSEGQAQSSDRGVIPLDPNEAESELEWRKERLEREQFLHEQRLKEAAENVEEDAKDSQLFRLGVRALRKNKNTKIPNNDVPPSIITERSQTSVMRHTVADLFAGPGHGNKTFALQKAIHRGSFLARGEESLARLSVITKQNSDQAIIRTKKSRNFVFAHLSPAIDAPVGSDTDLDGQENDNTFDERSRKRKQTFSLTPAASKKSKKGYERS